ncbi:MAG: aldo/keto reductase [Amaricoccus sp.]|uniref:aldo/keto reductase n=1 Tax=Amaricoccus sp. TaxID=1872485 RepID=UPI0033153065
MRYTTLGRTELRVSNFCLGTMTWGTQNSDAEAFQQIDYALDQGVNFLDTAEMYPTTPLSAGTSGETERIIGRWLAKTGRREEVVLATKIVGAGNRTAGRDGAPIGPATLRLALDDSLRRLGTDRVDLYQLHWPNRGSYHFRRDWTFAPEEQPRGQAEEMLAILETLGELTREGKIRAVGLSNESAWGTATYLRLAEAHGLPRIASIQNEYSLMCRSFDLDLAELCHHEDVGLLAYSPLAAGLLTGKYAGGARPAGSRATINGDLGGRISVHSEPVAEAYVAIARGHGLDPAQMALAFAAARPFMASVIIGATSMEQLRTDLGAADVTLPAEVLRDIAALRRRHPRPL